jgi:hypothetical protein
MRFSVKSKLGICYPVNKKRENRKEKREKRKEKREKRKEKREKRKEKREKRFVGWVSYLNPTYYVSRQ